MQEVAEENINPKQAPKFHSITLYNSEKTLHFLMVYESSQDFKIFALRMTTGAKHNFHYCDIFAWTVPLTSRSALNQLLFLTIVTES